MTGDLGRYERMSQQAKMRAALRRDARLTPAEEWAASQAHAEAASRLLPWFTAGPPYGCHDCYAWVQQPFGGWAWTHGPAIDPQVRTVDLFGEPEQVEFCRHRCHGLGGEPLPVIALA